VSPRLKKILKWVLYPLFYLVALVFSLAMTFPYDRLKDRLVAEFNSRQPAGSGSRLEVESMSGYWLSGVEAQGIRLTTEPSGPVEDGKPAKPHTVEISDVHVRVSLLRLIVGTTHVAFGGEAFGGNVSGYTSDAGGNRVISVELEDVNVNDLPVMRDAVGLPMEGKLTGTVELTLPESKLSKAEGKIDLKIADLAVGDGKAKIRNTIALPRVGAGELTLQAEASDGRLKIEKLGANGKDLELAADGSIRLRDPLDASLAELSMRFKFSDAFKKRNDTTKALFGDPGSPLPGLFDLDPKNKQAKRPDGFYAYRVTGPLNRIEAQPAPLGAASGTGTPGRGVRGFSGAR